MDEDFETCYRAVSSRDSRFDGRFFTAVTSTGIYCRPICPARTPKRENVRFYPVAAAAAAAGFRACRRCRPDRGPGSPDWNVRADLVGRALRLIAAGAVDGGGVGELATRLHVSERHLNRSLVAEVGVGPLALARTRRAQTARTLLESTALPVSDIAFAAGYASIRQFNESMRQAFGRSPTELRGRAPRTVADGFAREGSGPLTLRLAYREPFDTAGVLAWFGLRAVEGVERVIGTAYQRTMRLPHAPGLLTMSDTGEGTLRVEARLGDLRDVTAAVRRCQDLFDLDADPAAVADVLRADPALRPLVDARPGLRVPGCADGFELAVRAVLGQQVSVAAARTFAVRLARRFGDALPDDTAGGGEEGWWLFPTAARLAAAGPDELRTIGLTTRRAATLHALAVAVAEGGLTLDRGADRAAAAAALPALPGIGAWTAAYVGLRALGDPDAFPASDLGLRKAAEALGLPGDPRALAAHAERWRPWRGYAALHLWSSLDG